MKPLANDFIVAYRSANPTKEFLYTPAILVLKSGRYVMSLDITDKAGKICVSDDKGQTWRETGNEQFHHASLFLDGSRIWLLGSHTVSGDLLSMYSDDDGESWSQPGMLTEGQTWFHCATDVCYKDGYVYIPMDQCYLKEGETIRSKWPPNILAPVLLRGKLGADLRQRENWLFSESVRFRDVASEANLRDIGVPFFASQEDAAEEEDYEPASAIYRQTYDHENNKEARPFRYHAVGWLEANVVQITDPEHYWYDPTGKTLHLFMRANSHITGYGCVMKAVETVEDGKEVIKVECVTVPSGKRMLFLPIPGGQNKFFIKYDEKTKLYWLLSVQATDSMRRLECLSPDRYNIPSDERDRLALHFSSNMVDWCFAGLVAKSGHSRQARHYASMDFDGEDLIVLSRSGDENAASAHNGNMITLHRIPNFRDLVY